MRSQGRASHPLWWLLPTFLALAIGLGGGVGLAVRDLASSPGATTTAPPPTSPTSPTDTQLTGSTTVRLAEDVIKDPRREQVLDLMQRHFDAINRLDYDGWADTVTAARAAGMGRDAWRADYQSTRDTDILVHRVEPTTYGFVVLLSFVSEQLPELAPPDLPVECIRWRVSYPVEDEAGQLRIAGSNPDASQKQAC